MRVYFVVLKLQSHAMQILSLTGSPNTYAGMGLIRCAMIGADEIAMVGSKKLIVYPVEGDAYMTATIEIRKKITLIIDQHGLERSAAALESKFLTRPVAELPDFRNKLSSKLFGPVPGRQRLTSFRQVREVALRATN